MIYDFPLPDAPIRQGEIFVGVPKVEISMGQIPVVKGEWTGEQAWTELAKIGQPVNAVVAIRPVTAIVITQDCDAIRSREISLCEIRKFQEVECKASSTRDPKGWVSILTQHARVNLKWFYLPPDERIGFSGKMAVDFTATLGVRRKDLETFREIRKGRLNSVAEEHFRERLAEFFRRYPYDEWYPFDAEELAEYRKKYPDAAPFPWQQSVKD